MILAQVSESVIETKRTLDLRFSSLPEGSVHAKTTEGCAQLGMIKGMGVNLSMLPLQTLHVLHLGVLDEL